MKRIVNITNYCLLVVAMWQQVSLYAQNDGQHHLDYCHQSEFLERIRIHKPEVYQALQQDRAVLTKHTANYSPQKSDEIYTIPIVFHILHNDGIENISDAQIHEAVAILNRDYRRLNADANNVKTEFQNMPADIKVEFKLATIAPDGTCFGGITRTKSWRTNTPGDIDSAFQVKEVFNNNDVYRGMWPHEKYLNVVVAHNIGGAGGYTMYPNDEGTYLNTIFIQHITLGESGTAVTIYNRSLTHEVGHWLNLMHTWGDSNSPGLPSNCDIDDDVADTPNTIGLTSCDLNNHACGPLANTENYMEYSYCSKMFTPGQATRMRAALTSTVGGRNEIWKEANLQAVGAIENPLLCRAEFEAKKQRICAGESIAFEDRSFNAVNGWSWFFEGGTPTTSTEKNPVITYNTAGVYTVTLTVSNGDASLTETKTAYIEVQGAYTNLPYHEGFEFFPTIENASRKLFVETTNDPIAFEVDNTASFSGTKSAKLNNFAQTQTGNDNLVSTPIDLSNYSVGEISFSYRYAYRKKQSSNMESLKAYFSTNCGQTWVEKTTFSTSSLANGIVEPEAWTPTSVNDWTTVHIPLNTSSYSQFFTDNFRFKLEFTANGGNNLYIDDINLYQGDPSDTPLTNPQDEIDYKNSISTNGIAENNVFLENVHLFPNPSEGQVNVHFSLNRTENVSLSVVDMMGKILKTTIIHGNSGNNIVQLDCAQFAKGSYFLRVSNNVLEKNLLFLLEK